MQLNKHLSFFPPTILETKEKPMSTPMFFGFFNFTKCGLKKKKKKKKKNSILGTCL